MYKYRVYSCLYTQPCNCYCCKQLVDIAMTGKIERKKKRTQKTSTHAKKTITTTKQNDSGEVKARQKKNKYTFSTINWYSVDRFSI